TQPEPEAAPAETPKKTDPVPLWQRFQRNLNEPIATQPREESRRPAREGIDSHAAEPVRDVVASSSHEAIEVEGEESQRPLWQKYRSSSSGAADDIPVSDVEKLILGRNAARIRDSFVTELFAGDTDSYMEVLDQLKHTRNWPEASRVIAENVFKRFQVNIYCEEAVAFTNAVEARFRVQEPDD
ncbi:MAG: hypothetical protein R3178_09905, partial [Rhodothermales bacterium]|nr:hypothetical protein [Rhodothermales bacterium]